MLIITSGCWSICDDIMTVAEIQYAIRSIWFVSLWLVYLCKGTVRNIKWNRECLHEQYM